MIDWLGHVKLVDFGISKLLSQKESFTHSFVGSMGYYSPEIKAKEGHNYLNDVYNLGVFLYDILHGQLPQTQAVFRPNLTPECVSLLKQLLESPPHLRLNGHSELVGILEHKWFHGVRHLVKDGKILTPPLLPSLKKNHFNERTLNEELTRFVKDIMADHYFSVKQPGNKFFGFDGDHINFTEDSTASQMASTLSSPIRKTLSTIEDDDEDASPHNGMSVKVFKHKSKKTREILNLELARAEEKPAETSTKSFFSFLFS